VILHLGLVAASLLTPWQSVPLVQRVERVATPYLSPLHLRVDQRPLGLARFDEHDWPHRIEWRLAAGGPWRKGPGDATQARRHSRLACAIAEAAAREDTATASMLLVPWVRRWARGVDATAGAQYDVRVIALAWSAEASRLVPEERLRVRIRAHEEAGTTGWVMVTTEERRLTALPPARPTPDISSADRGETARRAAPEVASDETP
jgi:hypothetical protein